MKTLLLSIIMVLFFQKPLLADTVKYPFVAEKQRVSVIELVSDLRGDTAQVGEREYLMLLRNIGVDINSLNDLLDPSNTEVKECDWGADNSPWVTFITKEKQVGIYKRPCKNSRGKPENILWYKGKMLLSLRCGNLLINGNQTQQTITKTIPHTEKRRCFTLHNDVFIPQNSINNGVVFRVGPIYSWANQNNNSHTTHHDRQLVCEQ